MYHSNNAVDLRDLCLVWGETVGNGSYAQASYWSDPWTCFFRFRRENTGFDPSQLSNNHLLAGTDRIADTIRSVEIGDQVTLSGYLVSYADERSPEYERRSSLTGEDAATERAKWSSLLRPPSPAAPIKDTARYDRTNLHRMCTTLMVRVA
jgi:hypothetical protein